MPSPDEIQFILMWRDCAVDGFVDYDELRPKLHVYGVNLCAWAAIRPYTSGGGNYIVLNPRGADLIATADAAGLDAETTEQEPAVCSECGGTKRVPVLGNFTNPCPSCYVLPLKLKGINAWCDQVLGKGWRCAEYQRAVYDPQIFGMFSPLSIMVIDDLVPPPVDTNPPGLGED